MLWRFSQLGISDQCFITVRLSSGDRYRYRGGEVMLWRFSHLGISEQRFITVRLSSGGRYRSRRDKVHLKIVHLESELICFIFCMRKLYELVLFWNNIYQQTILVL